jgi:Phage integrase SAM-like domain/Phage integrase family/Arm DNA-binding domain
MKIPTVQVVFNRIKRKRLTDRYPIHVRITMDRKSKFVPIPVPLKIHESEWNTNPKGNNWIKATNPFAYEINNKIKEMLSQINDIVKRYYMYNRTLTFNILIEEVEKKNYNKSFNQYVQDYIKNPTEKLEPATIVKYKTFSKHLNAFNNNIHFNDLTSELVTDFKIYLEMEMNLIGNTIKSYFTKFKKLVTLAEKDSYIDIQNTKFLFTDTKIKVKEPERTYLELEEIKKLQKLKFAYHEAYLERNRDIFLFQIYTALYYKDLPLIEKSQLKDKAGTGIFLLANRNKNDNKTIIPLYKFKDSERILNRYITKDETSKFLFENKNFIEEPVYNRQLKIIAKKAGIQKSISNKTARHTNAQLWIHYGTKREVVSKMMGHSKSETTQEYFKINLNDVEEGVKHVNFEDLGL